ncbi:hypothetical protein [Acetobacter orleanensis]|nr:hypothetical protein [Acetobacter orleanensis]
MAVSLPRGFTRTARQGVAEGESINREKNDQKHDSRLRAAGSKTAEGA